MPDMTRSTRTLLALLHDGLPGPTLDVGSDQGAVALETGGTYVHVDLTACEGARAAGAASVIHTDILPAGPFGTIVFDADDYEPALAAEAVAQTAARLAPGGVLLTTARRTAVEACFENVEEHGEALVARSPRPGVVPEPWPSYTLAFGEAQFQVQTAPGVFSPRGLDEGTRVMLGCIDASPGARFLDLGCGAGVVSRIASEVWGCNVTAVDVNARALRLTNLNAPSAEAIASDGFRHLGDRQFDIIASNPPYHTDFAVAKAFIEGAFRHLVMGGTLYLVVKRADWYTQKVRSVFGGMRVVQENDYTVVIAQKRPPRPDKPAPAAQATTRKHAKRLARGGKR
ncbi:MAG TPA: methyltransferase [Symbiobacteriaceae bacterium]|nr:methyltransferase [Symbiobacteriaceae bacterium]